MASNKLVFSVGKRINKKKRNSIDLPLKWILNKVHYITIHRLVCTLFQSYLNCGKTSFLTIAERDENVIHLRVSPKPLPTERKPYRADIEDGNNTEPKPSHLYDNLTVSYLTQHTHTIIIIITFPSTEPFVIFLFFL